MIRENVALDDRYALESGRILLSGIQALVRLPMLQARRDAAAGLDTAGFISGYRGSPLGGLDQALWGASKYLDAAGVRFQPGVNEDLAATSVQGSQQVGLFPGARHDGVFGMWYGKAPGVDRSGDAFRHANAAGTAPHGGVLALAGDDHGCKSSTLPSQSEYAFMDLGMPVLSPAGRPATSSNIGLLRLGAVAASAAAGLGLSGRSPTPCDSTATVDAGEGPGILLPEDFRLPPGGLGIRLPDTPLEQEERLIEYKLPAARAFARANGIDRLVVPSPQASLGIVATGKAWLDVCQALDRTGHLPERRGRASAACMRLTKIGMPWPLDDATASATSPADSIRCWSWRRSGP
ncbi:MAG: hypothetical protein U5R48_05120 [Gammaproteobacteria bacterium]|nr:hypothetical protein [Gammaproteobacteria bacterium]